MKKWAGEWCVNSRWRNWRINSSFRYVVFYCERQFVFLCYVMWANIMRVTQFRTMWTKWGRINGPVGHTITSCAQTKNFLWSRGLRQAAQLTRSFSLTLLIKRCACLTCAAANSMRATCIRATRTRVWRLCEAWRTARTPTRCSSARGKCNLTE